MVRLPDTQVAAYARGATVGVEANPKYARYRAKWNTAENIAIATATAIGESGKGDPKLADTEAQNPAGAYGLWQIFKPAHPELFKKYNWSNPADNAKMAFIIWADAGGSWKPWVIYTTGIYLQYLDRGRKAAGQNVPDPIEIPNPLEPLNKINEAFTFFTNPDNWIRVGYFVTGIILLWVALWQITGVKNVAKQAIAVYTRGAVQPK